MARWDPRRMVKVSTSGYTEESTGSEIKTIFVSPGNWNHIK